MKPSYAFAAMALSAIMFLAAPAWARAHFVIDGASLFNANTIDTLDQKISAFNQQTGKEILVVTVPSLNGKTLRQATEDEFAQEQVNGVLIFMSKADHQDAIVSDRAARAFFPSGSLQNIREAMRGYFRGGDFDTGIQTGVNLALDQYRSHERAVGASTRRTIPLTTTTQQSFGGFGVFWFILTVIAGFLILRAIFRAFAGPRMMPPGYGGPGYGGPGPGFGGGYGPGYGGGGGGGFGGGGGGFFSGLLGGLGGAWLGNELFGNRGNTNIIDGNQAAGFDGNQSIADNSGWQSDAGQADMNDASFGGYGDSGGGFDAGGGGGFDGGGDSGGGGW
jgi:uncharacterized membrane protein YgcG